MYHLVGLVLSPQAKAISQFSKPLMARFLLWDKCPHKGGPLSQGIVSGHSVTCPLHNWVVALDTGNVKGPDKGCARKVKLVIEDGRIFMEAAALRRDAA